MHALNNPAMSVVIVTPGEFDCIRTTVRHLRAQTVHEQIEVVILAVSESQLNMAEAEKEGFWGIQVISMGPIESIPKALATGIRQSRGPLVALAEDHCFPEREWAAALIARHQENWAVVGPAVCNANPGTLVSWADFVIAYGPWMDPVEAGPMEFLPGHNSCYKRSILLEYGDRLEEMMEAETVMHFDLRRRGHPLYLESAARTRHMNYALFGSWTSVTYCHGRVFAAVRARPWRWPKRVFYGAASPLIPWVRLYRCVRVLLGPGRPRHLIFRVLPVMAVGLMLDGIGQFAGYLTGDGDALGKLSQMEFNRIDHVTEEDRRRFRAGAADAGIQDG
jgi:hypothetical protein